MYYKLCVVRFTWIGYFVVCQFTVIMRNITPVGVFVFALVLDF